MTVKAALQIERRRRTREHRRRDCDDLAGADPARRRWPRRSPSTSTAPSRGRWRSNSPAGCTRCCGTSRSDEPWTCNSEDAGGLRHWADRRRRHPAGAWRGDAARLHRRRSTSSLGRLIAPLVLIAIGASIVLGQSASSSASCERDETAARRRHRRRGGSHERHLADRHRRLDAGVAEPSVRPDLRNSWPLLIILGGVMIVIRGHR